MKIAILDMDDLKNPHWGSGQAVVTREVGKRLSKSHEITVYSSKYPGYQDYVQDGINYKHIGLATNSARINNLAFLLSLPFVARKLKADIIVEDFTAPFSTCFTPLFTKIPVVGRGSFFAADELSKKYKLPFGAVERFGLKFYKYFICMNKAHETKIKKINDKIEVRLIYNGVDSQNFDRPTTEDNFLLFIGRLDIIHKGLDMLFDAFAKASDKIQDNLYIMGSGPDKEKLDEWIKQKGLEGRVKFLGKLSGEEKFKYFTSAKYTVFPSRYEGQSLASLESLSMGKPFIYFDVGGFDWVEDSASVRIPAFDVEAYSNSIVKLSNDSSYRAQLVKSSKEFARNFDWDVVAKRYESFFNEISAQNKHE